MLRRTDVTPLRTMLFAGLIIHLLLPRYALSQDNAKQLGQQQTPDDTGALVVLTKVPEYIEANGSSLPQAKSVDLGEPVTEPTTAESSNGALTEKVPEKSVISQVAPLILLGTEVPPLTSTRLSWTPAQSFEGLASPTPVLVVHGGKPGPVLCLTAAIHGDELNGMELVRRVLYNTKPEDLSGSIIGVPIVNLQGFQRGSRYLPDRRDLNRLFPGYPEGSAGARIAHSFFQEVIRHCTVLVDLHTGSFHRSNLPQLRADLSNPDVVELTHGFGATVVLHSGGAVGTLRRAAVDSGIPAVTLEAGEPLRLQEDAVAHSVKSIQTLLNHLGMVKKTNFWGDPEPVYYKSTWVRADRGGVLFSEVELGARVQQGDLLGAVTNPITNVRTEIRSKHDGRVLGMALNQVVMPGFAAFHIGIRAPQELITTAETPQLPAVIDEAQQKVARRSPAEIYTPAADPDDSSEPGEDVKTSQILDEHFDSN
jgi:predicted deacylase